MMQHSFDRVSPRRHTLAGRLFEPGWSGRFGAIMLTAGIAVAFIVIGIGVA